MNANGLLEESLGLAVLNNHGVTRYHNPREPFFQREGFMQAEAHQIPQVSNITPLSPEQFLSGGLEDVILKCGSRNWNWNNPGRGLKVDSGLVEEDQSPTVNRTILARDLSNPRLVGTRSNWGSSLRNEAPENDIGRQTVDLGLSKRVRQRFLEQGVCIQT